MKMRRKKKKKKKKWERKNTIGKLGRARVHGVVLQKIRGRVLRAIDRAVAVALTVDNQVLLLVVEQDDDGRTIPLVITLALVVAVDICVASRPVALE